MSDQVAGNESKPAVSVGDRLAWHDGSEAEVVDILPNGWLLDTPDGLQHWEFRRLAEWLAKGILVFAQGKEELVSECSITGGLTDVELEVAAKAADSWPRGHGKDWQLPDGRL